MDKDILNEVIEAEREIQQCIEQEQARLRAWLDEVKKEAAEAVARAEKNDGESLGRAIEDAKQHAEQQAKLAVAAAESRAARFKELDDAVLRAIIMKRLPRILLE
jgi:vacuolar-type H+-ATPase subunit H